VGNFVFIAYVTGMNIFVAFFVLLLLLSESTPKAAESIPLIGKNVVGQIKFRKTVFKAS